MSRAFSEQEINRREALTELRKRGVNPFPPEEFQRTHHSLSAASEFEKDESADIEVKLAGRIMSRRIMGKASFAELQDQEGRIQLYFNRDELCQGEDKSLYNEVFKKLLDIGDIVGIEGKVFRTKVGEVSVEVKSFTILSKALRPLPVVKTDEEGNKHDAFTDPEQRYRQRYVDLIVNPEVRETFIKRSQVINSMRAFFNQKGYLEVETPILQPIPGGAAARPFITHHNSLNTDLYLRVANELYLKRLIVGGYEGVYEFAKDFRNEGMDRTHNPEFTVMEIYVAYKDYHWMMNFTEELLEKVCLDVHGSSKVEFQGKQIDFKAPYRKVPIFDAIKEYTGHDLKTKSEEEIRQVCKELKIEVDQSMGRGKLIDEIFGEHCEKNFLQPTFIIDYPVEMSPLCKKHREDPTLTERFELMVNGKEVANAYTELNDPIDQLERFQDQLKLSEKGDDEAMFIDQDFVRALEYGMPPTSGMGIGIDRLVMFLTNNVSIQEVLFFPQMKPEAKKVELSDSEKVIFNLLKYAGEINLLELKEKAALSNKQWDKGMKGLNKKQLAQVVVEGDDKKVVLKA